jgi:hypothetical protein
MYDVKTKEIILPKIAGTLRIVVNFEIIQTYHKYGHLIYPDELEIKDTTESDKSGSYLDI